MFNENVEELFDRVSVGTRVIVETGAVIPPGGNYVVQPGDTLYLIALRFDTTVEALMRVNNLTSDLIFPGANPANSRGGPAFSHPVSHRFGKPGGHPLFPGAEIQHHGGGDYAGK